MVREIKDAPQYKDKKNLVPDNEMREITIEYNSNNTNDERIIKMIEKVISDNQPTCFNCKNHYSASYFGNYQAICCRIHGCLEDRNNPHYYCVGSKCDDYEREQ